MSPDDRAYYLQRAAEEDEAACNAACAAARNAHEQLASLYRWRCEIGIVRCVWVSPMAGAPSSRERVEACAA